MAKNQEYIKVTTKSGFKCNLFKAALDDMELLEMLSALDKGQVQVIPDILLSMLGAEQKKALYDFCRVDGRVSTTRVGEMIMEIFSSQGDEGKNS